MTDSTPYDVGFDIYLGGAARRRVGTSAGEREARAERTEHMAKGIHHIPEGLPAVTPQLVCKDARALVAWAGKAFGAELAHAMPNPDGKGIMHGMMVIGGAKIYALALPRADRMVLTVVQGDFAGDVFFPRFEPGAWACVGHTVHEVSARDAHRWAVFDWRREGLDDAASRAAWMQSLGPDT